MSGPRPSRCPSSAQSVQGIVRGCGSPHGPCPPLTCAARAFACRNVAPAQGRPMRAPSSSSSRCAHRGSPAAPAAGADGDTPDPKLLERARSILQRAPLIDTTTTCPTRSSSRRWRGPDEGGPGKAAAGPPADIPRLREGRVGAQYWSVYVDSETPAHPELAPRGAQDLRPQPPDDREPPRAGACPHRGRHRADQQVRRDRLAARSRGRSHDREPRRRGAHLPPPGRALPDAHPLAERGVGRRGHRHPRTARPDQARRGCSSGSSTEPESSSTSRT
jgi:hypothetical protein